MTFGDTLFSNFAVSLVTGIFNYLLLHQELAATGSVQRAAESLNTPFLFL